MESIYSKITKIFDMKFASCFIYSLRPNTIEENHYHDGIEIVYVIKGKCKTHKRGRFYFYKKRRAHGVVNDSKKDLIFICFQLPPETQNNTHSV